MIQYLLVFLVIVSILLQLHTYRRLKKEMSEIDTDAAAITAATTEIVTVVGTLTSDFATLTQSVQAAIGILTKNQSDPQALAALSSAGVALGTASTSLSTLDASLKAFAASITPVATATAPVVAGLSPTSGPGAGGTPVAITGSGFTGATAVSFGSLAAESFTVSSDTTIAAVSPAGADGIVDVVVNAPGGTSVVGPADKYTYIA